MLKVRSVSGHVSPTRYPPPPPSLLRPRYRTSSLLLGSSDFPTLSTVASLFTLGFGCDAPSSLPLGSPRLPHVPHVKLGQGLRSRVGSAASPWRLPHCGLRAH